VRGVSESAEHAIEVVSVFEAHVLFDDCYAG